MSVSSSDSDSDHEQFRLPALPPVSPVPPPETLAEFKEELEALDEEVARRAGRFYDEEEKSDFAKHREYLLREIAKREPPKKFQFKKPPPPKKFKFTRPSERIVQQFHSVHDQTPHMGGGFAFIGGVVFGRGVERPDVSRQMNYDDFGDFL